MEYIIRNTDTHYGSDMKLTEYEIMSKEPESFNVGTLNKIVRILREEVYLTRLIVLAQKENNN